MPNLITETDLLSAKPELAGNPDLPAMIRDASDAIHRHCKRNVLVKGPVIEKIDGNDYHELNLSEWPIVDVTVEIDGVPLDPDQFEVDSESGQLIRLKRLWPRGRRNIAVQYTAGYDPLPGVIRRAMILTIGSMDRQSSDAEGLKRLRTRDQEEEWFPGASEVTIPMSAQSLLIGLVKHTSR